MNALTVDEKCGCGAEFHWHCKDNHPNAAANAAAAWRRDHRHIEPSPVGICGDQPPPLILTDGGTDQPWCELPAGHPGAHSDGAGRHWIKAWTARPTADRDHPEESR